MEKKEAHIIKLEKKIATLTPEEAEKVLAYVLAVKARRVPLVSKLLAR